MSQSSIFCGTVRDHLTKDPHPKIQSRFAHFMLFPKIQSRFTRHESVCVQIVISSNEGQFFVDRSYSSYAIFQNQSMDILSKQPIVTIERLESFRRRFDLSIYRLRI